MSTIYTAVYICKQVIPVGLPGYNNVRLGLPGLFSNSDIIISGTVSRFVIGKEYVISIMEKP